MVRSNKGGFMRRLGWIAIGMLTLLAGCKGDEPDLSGSVTRIQLSFVWSVKDANGFLQQFSDTFEWNDPDGPGGAQPVADQIILPPRVAASCVARVYDGSDTLSVRELTLRIKNQRQDYQVCYLPTNGLAVVISVNDLDSNTLPVGLETGWQTGAVSAGDVAITIRYAPGAKTANCFSMPIETEAIFPVSLQ